MLIKSADSINVFITKLTPWFCEMQPMGRGSKKHNFLLTYLIESPIDMTSYTFWVLRRPSCLKQLCVGEDLSVLPAAEEAERRREEAQRADEEVEATQRCGHFGHQDLKSVELL